MARCGAGIATAATSPLDAPVSGADGKPPADGRTG